MLGYPPHCTLAASVQNYCPSCASNRAAQGVIGFSKGIGGRGTGKGDAEGCEHAREARRHATGAALQADRSDNKGGVRDKWTAPLVAM